MSKQAAFPHSWGNLVYGCLFVATIFVCNSPVSTTFEFAEVTTILSADVQTTKGRKTHRDYVFESSEYSVDFVIPKGSVSASQRAAIARITKGQNVTFTIKKSDLIKLHSALREVSVYGLSDGGNLLLTPRESLGNQDKYQLRVKILAGFIALMLLLNGLFDVSVRLNWVLVGLFLFLFILVRMFRVGIY